MTKPVIAWSHSACEKFTNCPKQFYEVRIAKAYKDTYGEAANWGQKVHAAFDRYFKMGASLPSNMSQYQPLLDKTKGLAKQLDYFILSELELAVDINLQPCSWRDWDTCWSRCALDALLMSDASDVAISIDWKTGKRKDNDAQLALQAAFVFRHYPHINTVRSMFGWVKDLQFTHVEFHRQHEDRLWKQYLPVVRKMTDAVLHGDWPANRSGLCKEYCPVKICRHNGMYQGDQ